MLDQYNKKLSPYEYFIRLQLEFVSIGVRSKIFISNKNKQHWEDIKEKKRIKIEEFAQMNHLKTIFSDAELREEIENIFYENGVPNFTYRDANHEYKQKPFDLLSYYQVNEEVSYTFIDGSQQIGKIASYQLNSNVIQVKTHLDDLLVVPVKNCKRILFDFY